MTTLCHLLERDTTECRKKLVVAQSFIPGFVEIAGVTINKAELLAAIERETAPPATISKPTKGFIAEWSGRPLRSNPKPNGKRY